MSKPCIFRGSQVGSMIIGCCGGKERSQSVHECLHQKRNHQYACESISTTSIANVEINGQRQPLKVASCQSCDLKLVSINLMPAPIVENTKPVSRIQQDIEERRRRRLPSNPRQRVVVLDCNLHGIGDTVVAAWIAEGAKNPQGDDPSVVLCATNQRRQFLEMLGQTIHYPVAPGSVSGIGSFYLSKRVGQGCPPFAIARARNIGLTTDLARPPVSIPQELKDWAQMPANKSQVVLFPQSSQVSRTWPLHKWIELHDKLTARGLSVRVAEQFPTIMQSVPVYTRELSLVQMVAMIDAAELVIGNDSGPMHIAGTLDKPAISIHGMTSDVTFSHCRSIRTVEAERRLVPCSGCWLGWGYDAKACERSCKALESIMPDRVANLAMDIMNGKA